MQRLDPDTPGVACAPVAPIGPRAERWVGWSGMLLAAALLLLQVANNPNIELPDELGHLVVAREAWTRPVMIFNTWGRTANTLVFMPVARLPLSAARLWAVGMSLAACGLARSFARRAGLKLACLTPWLIALQPQFVGAAWGVVTQTPFSLALIGAAWLAQRGRWRAAALVAGLLPLIRHEGIALTGAFGLLCLWRRDGVALLWLALPLALLNLSAWLCIRKWLSAIYFNPRSTTFYGTGLIRDCFYGLFHKGGLLLFLLALLGLLESPRKPVLLLLAGFNALYFLIHALLFKFGLYSSGGYLIFLSPLAPALGILAAAGADELTGRLFAAIAAGWGGRPAPPWARRLRLPGRHALERYFMLAMVLGVASSGLTVDLLWPQEVGPVDETVDRAVDFLRAQRLAHRPIVSVHPRFYYRMPYPVPNTDERLWINTRPLKSMPPGTIVLWELFHSNTLGLPIDQLRRPGSPWRALWSTPYAIVFEKQAGPPANDS